MNDEPKLTDKHDLTISTVKADAISKAISNIHPGLSDAFTFAYEAVKDGDDFDDAIITIRIVR